MSYRPPMRPLLGFDWFDAKRWVRDNEAWLSALLVVVTCALGGRLIYRCAQVLSERAAAQQKANPCSNTPCTSRP